MLRHCPLVKRYYRSTAFHFLKKRTHVSGPRLASQPCAAFNCGDRTRRAPSSSFYAPTDFNAPDQRLFARLAILRDRELTLACGPPLDVRPGRDFRTILHANMKSRQTFCSSDKHSARFAYQRARAIFAQIVDFSARLRYHRHSRLSRVRFHAQGRCPRRSISLPRIMQRFRITRWRRQCLFLTEPAQDTREPSVSSNRFPSPPPF